MPPSRMRFISGITPAEGRLTFTFEAREIPAHPGESIASALMRAGTQALRRTRRAGAPRGYFCGMGVCWECAVHVEGRGVVRACCEAATEGMTIRLAEEDV